MPYKHGIFGCFDNCGLCLITYLAPCYTLGKNAEAVGESCFLCGLAYFIPTVHIIAHLMVRMKIRESSGIEGSIVEDLLLVLFCPFCSLVQDAQEVQSPSDTITIVRS